MIAALVIAAALGEVTLPQQPEGDEVTWTQGNVDATYVARQTARPGGGCHLAVVHDGDQSVLWEKDGCFGGKSDRHLLSRDGARLVLLASLPAFDGKRPDSWRTAPVAWLVDRGTPVESAVAGQLVKDANMVRKTVTHFSWLQGVGGVPGVPPKLNEPGDGVELDAIDGKHTVLGFAGFNLPPLPVAKTKQAKKTKHGKKKHH